MSSISIAPPEETPDEFQINGCGQEMNEALIAERSFPPRMGRLFKPATFEGEDSVRCVVVVAAGHFDRFYFLVYSCISWRKDWNFGVLSTEYTANCGLIFAGYHSWWYLESKRDPAIPLTRGA